MTRISEREFGGPYMFYWDGTKWLYREGQAAVLQDRQWRGLAFNPESAAIGWDIANGCSGLIITEYAP